MLTDNVDVMIPLDGQGDHLGQSGVLRTLLTTVEHLPAGTCVALYGPWGSGKTALLRAAHDALAEGLGPDGKMARENFKHVTIWFDPWEYERVDDVLTPLLKRIIQAASDNLGANAETGEFWGKVRGVLKTGMALSLRLGLRWAVGSVARDLTMGADGTPDGSAAKEHWLHALDKVDEKTLTQYFKAWSKKDDEIAQMKGRVWVDDPARAGFGRGRHA